MGRHVLRRLRSVAVLAVLLQIGGALIIAAGLAIVRIWVGVLALGVIMLVFGIAYEEPPHGTG